MSTFATASTPRGDNLGYTARWASALAGLAILLSVGRKGGVVGQLARSGVGLSLLARGATGYCPMKGAMRGESTLREGLREQWRRLSADIGVAAERLASRPTLRLEDMEGMYVAELQELHSAEAQLIVLSRELMRVIGAAPLAFRIEEYATELQVRRADLEGLLGRASADTDVHPDEAMRALIQETHKMAEVAAENVRDAAVAASIQRIIHYKIAGYGAIAAYARALRRPDEAAYFAQLAARDQTIDAEIADIAKDILNPEAALSPQESPATEMRTH